MLLREKIWKKLFFCVPRQNFERIKYNSVSANTKVQSFTILHNHWLTPLGLIIQVFISSNIYIIFHIGIQEVILEKCLYILMDLFTLCLDFPFPHENEMIY